MRKIKLFSLVLCCIITGLLLCSCGNSNTETDGETSMFGEYEFLDMDLFRMRELSLTINGSTYTVGMTKDEIEDMLGEEGEGYRHVSRSDSSSGTSTGNYIIEPDSYEYYYTVDNYYYYPNNGVAIIYRGVHEGQVTNNPAVLISAKNPSVIDSEGFSPETGMLADVKEHIINRYGEESKDDMNGSEIELCYDENGNYVPGRNWTSGGWKFYYSYNGKEIDSITVGCKGTYGNDTYIRSALKN